MPEHAKSESPGLSPSPAPPRRRWSAAILGLFGLAAAAAAAWGVLSRPGGASPARLVYAPRKLAVDFSGFADIVARTQWDDGASLDEIRRPWPRAGYREIERLDRELADLRADGAQALPRLLEKAAFYVYEGEAGRAYEVLGEARALAESRDDLAAEWLYTVVYGQGVTALRRGETDNCILCRGESSCILPIAPAAVHTRPEGSRRAIHHFTEYLRQFPDDLDVRWLLNLAHMTLGEHPDKVEPAYLVPLDRYLKSEFDIGRFRDVGQRVGVARFNQGGGAIMDDFDGDGLLDIVVTCWDATTPMAFYRNRGVGTFEDRTQAAEMELRG